jgi:predicted dehydrogenase
MKKLNVVVVGLGFGSAFVPLYLNHPDVAGVGVCDTNAAAIQNMINRYGHGLKTYSSFDDVLADENVDCVHILTPPMFHVEMSEKALLAGKHTACAVTMGTTIDGLQRVVDAVKKSGKNYAMMETAIFTRNFLYAKNMLDTGKMGEVQFLNSEYYQDVEGLQDHWIGYPPMHYASHAIAPLVYLANQGLKAYSVWVPVKYLKKWSSVMAIPLLLKLL